MSGRLADCLALHTTNAVESLAHADATVHDYVQFFFSIVARLEAHRGLLDNIVYILEEKQDPSGAELRHLFASEERPRHTRVST